VESAFPVLTSHRKRFREIIAVLEVLKALDVDNELPELPEKKFFGRFSSDFVERRRKDIEYFLNAALRNRFLSRHPRLVELLEMDGLVSRFESGRNPPSPRALHVPAQEPKLPEVSISTEELSKCKRGTLIGSGSFGKVFLGLLPSHQLLVAVKVVPFNPEIESQHLARVASELNLLRSLGHPNIVRYLGCVTDEERHELSIYTEYVECGSIGDLIKKFGPLPLAVIQKYMYQILEGLRYLHEQQITHRDIKADNILVTKKGRVKLADFGSAMVLHASLLQGREAPAASVEIAGSPLFCAPEIIDGGPPSPAADIWSLGCVGIEMLQRRVWNVEESENIFAVLFRIGKKRCPPDGLPTLEDCPSPEFIDFLKLCFEVDPARRPGAAELLEHPFFDVNIQSGSVSPVSPKNER
jgi:hypothetical protein